MTTNTATPTRGPYTTERTIAAATSLAPIAAGVLAPFLNTDAATIVDLTTLASAGIATANILDALPNRLYHQLPAGDILRAHRLPNFIAHLTTSVALGMGTLAGPDGTDALMAGFLQTATHPIPGIVSLGWWAATLLVPYQLRRILGLGRPHPNPHPATHHPAPPTPNMPPVPATAAEQAAYRWAQYISHPDNGSHRNQNVTITEFTPTHWTGTITAPTGANVTVTPETISSVYGIPTDWITIRNGTHAGQRTITVNLQPPADLDTSTLAGAWKKWAARTGGIMAGTHLEDVQPDPHTGGEVARIVANEDTDALPTPNMRDLVGALRTSHVLLSYEPSTDPRTAVIRLMKENPLQGGIRFPGPDALQPSPGGYFRIGAAVSGRPLRAQLLDPKLGARHLYVTGVTGSGKGGVLQLIALAAHLAGAVIIYADPKGSSNPAIERMAAYTGLGEDGAMGALLLTEALVDHRIDLTGRLKQKNCDITVTPHVVFILDEASTLLGEKAAHRKRATQAVAQIAKKGRSLGVSEVLANQLLQLAEIGGDSAIRDNIVGSGGVIMLRADSSQRHLIDLPPGLEDVNPADIPATWTGDDKAPLIYTDDTHIQDPESTFGLGYYMTTDRVRAMGRTYDLEDATEYVNPDRIAEPFDWPDWENRHEIVAALMAQDEDDTDPATASTLFTGIELTKKPETAEDKILDALRGHSDPLGIETVYLHKDDIGRITGLKETTLNGALTRLKKAGQIHSGPERATYGLGSGTEPGE